jgi:phosphatidylserine/phosphatidylglycerophosphate/cardiolipin synthase-like enzyme
MTFSSRVHAVTLTDGGQTAAEIGDRLAQFISAATRTLEIAIYDIRLPDPHDDAVRAALLAASERGVQVRLMHNVDYPDRIPVPPPPHAELGILQSELPFPIVGIEGVPDLMHHKYVVRDGAAVWSGSTNWTVDSWTREENVIVTVESGAVAARFLEDFEQLWQRRDVRKSGRVDTAPVAEGIRVWFCPGRGEKLAHRIAKAIGTAKRRVRIASPVISSGPILGTLAQAVTDRRVDVAGVVDQTQIQQVIDQWRLNGNAPWKEPLLRTSVASFSGKRSTPYRPDAVHDYMHAKVTVCDDTIFVGSFNLSHSGELNAENVLEIRDSALADRLAAFIDEIRARYPRVELH